MLSSQILLSNITRTNLALINVQQQMASGKAVNRPSDDSVRAAGISILEDRLERRDQRLRNLSSATASLGLLDSSLGDANDLLHEARGIASGQIGVTSDATTRKTQAVVIDSMIQELYLLANRETNGLYIFGGSTPSQRPIEELYGGFRYVGRGSGLITDLDLGGRIPVTIGGDNAIGETSARLKSTIDLDPGLTLDTRLDDLNGARGVGISPGVISFSFDGSPAAEVDLTEAETVGDVVEALTAAIQQYESQYSVTILNPGGVSVSGGSISIDVAAGAPDPQLTFSESGLGAMAEDLGLTAAPFEATNTLGASTDPRLTMLTDLSAIPGLTLPLGSIRISFTRNGNAVNRDIDLSSAQTLDDVRNLIETGAPGVRVQINNAGTGIDVFNEVSGPAMSIQEVSGGALTATQLGIRSLNASTLLSDFNHGRGVEIANGAVDPETGLPDPAHDVDFTIQLGNGDSFAVDLRPEDVVSVQTVIDRINAQAAAAVTAGDIPAGAFNATLTDGANGIAFQDLAGLGEISVAQNNNSPAAEQLGLLDGAFDAPSATFLAQDRATVRVDSLFTQLMDLRDSLLNDDVSGITLAGEDIQQSVDRLAGARALVGVYDSRVERETTRQEDQSLLDEQFRSQLQDLDFAEAAVRFNLLQTQLTASLSVGAQTQTRSLLDFLG
jgi:flagellar hook-associated protein 3 FlgL